MWSFVLDGEYCKRIAFATPFELKAMINPNEFGDDHTFFFNIKPFITSFYATYLPFTWVAFL